MPFKSTKDDKWSYSSLAIDDTRTILSLFLNTSPLRLSFAMQALLLNHYTRGGYYPVGGASEIAHGVIPVIEEAGGKVMVRVMVEEILMIYLSSKKP